jgi:hypothetical protein
MQARPEQELMRRHADQRLERPQEMIAAHRRLPGELGQAQRLLGARLDAPQGPGDAARVTHRRRGYCRACVRERRRHRAGQPDREFFIGSSVAAARAIFDRVGSFNCSCALF